jgi:hypothetical protein
MQQRRWPEFLWHSHPGPMIVDVTEGELVYAPAEDCSRRSYPAGTASVDPGHGHVHSAFNPTDAETALVATFFEAPAQGPLLIPAQARRTATSSPGGHRTAGGSRAQPNSANRRLAAVRQAVGLPR